MFFKGNSSKKNKADVDGVVESTSVENISLTDQISDLNADDTVDEVTHGEPVREVSKKMKSKRKGAAEDPRGVPLEQKSC